MYGNLHNFFILQNETFNNNNKHLFIFFMIVANTYIDNKTVDPAWKAVKMVLGCLACRLS